MNSLETIEVLRTLQSSPEMIRGAAEALLEARLTLAALEADRASHEMTLLAAIAAERNDDGKPRYPNETARKIELDARLRNDSLGASIQERTGKLTHDVRKCEIDLAFARDTFAASQSVARILARDVDG